MRKITYVAIMLAVLLALGIPALGGPGGGDDPLVSLSYMDTVFHKPFKGLISEKVALVTNAAMAKLEAELKNKNTSIDQALGNRDGVIKAMQNAVVANLRGNTAVAITLNKGESIKLNLGAKVMIVQGGATLNGTEGDIYNITRGTKAKVGTAAPKYMNYLFASNTGSFTAVEDKTQLMVIGTYTLDINYRAENTKYAQALKDLGLFKGTEHGFQLDTKGDRVQGIIMLIRLMGQEGEALKHSGKTSFIDLSAWAEGHKYIGYGFDKGYTKGVNTENTLFNPTEAMMGETYYTFVLRALGYDDSKGDFHWKDSSGKKAVEIGLLTQTEHDKIAKNGLYRDDLVKISYNALGAKLKDNKQTLGQKLVGQGVFTQSQLNVVAQYILAN